MSNENISRIEINNLYLEFPGDTDPEQAASVFERRFKYAPAVVEKRGWRLMVGPVKSEVTE